MNARPLVKYLCALLLFGLNGIVASHIAANSYEIVFLRNLLGGALLAAIFFLSGGRLHVRENRRDVLFVLLAGMAMGGNWLFLYEAYKQVGVGIATLLCYCGPVIVMAISPLVFRERLTALKVAAFAVVVLGVVLVNGYVEGSLNAWGLFCGVMSAVMYAIMLVFNKKAQSVTGLRNPVIQLMGSFLLVAAFVAIQQGITLNVPAGSWPWALVLGLLNTGLGCYLYFSSIGALPVQTVAVCGYLEPLSAVVFAALLLGESMTVLQVIGAACIIGGAISCELSKPRKA